MRAAVATFATDSPAGRARSRYLPGGPPDFSQGGPAGSRASARINTLGVKKNSCRPVRPRIQPPLRARRLGQDEGERDSLGQLSECFSKLAGFMLAGRPRLHSRHTTAIQAKIQPQLGFIENRSRVRSVSSAPCLTLLKETAVGKQKTRDCDTYLCRRIAVVTTPFSRDSPGWRQGRPA